MGNRATSNSVTSTSSASSSYLSNGLNQYSGISTSYTGGASNAATAYAYDADGNMSSALTAVAGQGNTASTQYVYDDSNRLTDVISKNPTTGANVHKSTFVYDAFSRLRVTQEYNWNGSSWVKQTELRRNYDGMDCVETRDDGNNVQSMYVRNGGQLLAWYTDLQANALIYKYNSKYYYHQDGNGNVTELTDANQNVVANYQYDAYGNVLSSSGSVDEANTFRYSGKEYFSSVGLYNYGYRFYSPGMGRWINRDPQEEIGGIHLYAFAGNSPLNLYDPYGLSVTDPYGQQVGDVFRGYGDALNPVNWYNGAKSIYDTGKDCGGAAAAKAFGWGLFHGLTDWAITSDARRFGQSFGNVLITATAEAAPFAGGAADTGVAADAVAGPKALPEPIPSVRGLPPSGMNPPGFGPDWTIEPASRPSEVARGGQSMYDPLGGEWRYAPRDNWHYPHWDYKPEGGSWDNIPIAPGFPTHIPRG